MPSSREQAHQVLYLVIRIHIYIDQIQRRFRAFPACEREHRPNRMPSEQPRTPFPRRRGRRERDCQASPLSGLLSHWGLVVVRVFRLVGPGESVSLVFLDVSYAFWGTILVA